MKWIKGLNSVILMLVLTSMGVGYAATTIDPTRPPYFRDIKKEGFRKMDLMVSGIKIDNKRRIAIVNDEVLQVGDEISGVRVVAIHPNAVEFQNYEGHFSIPLHHSVKQEITGTN